MPESKIVREIVKDPASAWALARRTVQFSTIWEWSIQGQLDRHAGLKLYAGLFFDDEITLRPEGVLGSCCSNTVVFS